MSEKKGAFAFLEELKQREPRKKATFSTLLEYMTKEALKRGIPLYGQFELTPLCNFDCKMCYTHLTREQMRGKDLLDVDQWKGLMGDAVEAGMLSAVLTGGECLTYPGFRELYLYLRDRVCELTVMTNAALLDEDWVRFFTARRPSTLQITLYGGDEETYRRVTGQRKFSIVAENIRRAADAGLNVELSITPSKYMGEGAFDTLRAAKALGVPYTVNSFLFDPKPETGRAGQDHDLSVEDYVRLFKLYNELEGIETRETAPELLPPPGSRQPVCGKRGLPCRAGRACFAIEWDGRMFPCDLFRDVWAAPMEEGFQNAWNSIRQKCLAWNRIPECIDCPYDAVCINCEPQKARFTEPGRPPLKVCQRTLAMVQHGIQSLPVCE